MTTNRISGVNRNTVYGLTTYYQPCHTTQYVNTHNNRKMGVVQQ